MAARAIADALADVFQPVPALSGTVGAARRTTASSNVQSTVTNHT